ncbi:hypothetical protein ACOMHN_036426 [Nucella lapillus]
MSWNRGYLGLHAMGVWKMARATLDNQGWIQRWNDRAIGFHIFATHPMLLKHVNVLEDGRSNLRILMPLCGKFWDMHWLAQRGHTVVGVEVAERAVHEFLKEYPYSHTARPVPGVEGTLFQTHDKKIQIYCCDFFKITPEEVGVVDAVWDRGSMVSINVCDRPRYAQVMQSVMSKHCRYLLSALNYDETKYTGIPHHLGDEAIREVFENTNTVTEIDCSSNVVEKDHKKIWGLDWLREKIFLITPKL